MMKMVIEIGYSQYMIDPRDAILLLEIASRAVQVSQPEWGKPYRQTGNETPFITKAELIDYEPLALPEPARIPPEAARFAEPPVDTRTLQTELSEIQF